MRMRLADALRIQTVTTVAFIGAGGKSSAIRTLVNELQSEIPVVVTTTTKLGRSQNDLAHRHLILEDEDLISALRTELGSAGSLLVTNRQGSGESKWRGLSGDQMGVLRQACVDAQALLLIEADGARGKSLKAPAEHEPVIPDGTDLVVPIVGLDVVGKPFTAEYCHRAERARELLGVQGQRNISRQHITELLLSNRAGLKGIPSTAIVRCLLNHGSSPSEIDHGRAIARELLDSDRYQNVVIADLGGVQPIKESVGRIAGIVLAAGASTRLDGPKQGILFRGKALVVHAVEAALDGDLEPVLVIVGEQERRMRELLDGYPIKIIRNPHPDSGQSSSLRIGLAALESNIEGAIFLLADMPLVRGVLVVQLREHHRQTLAPIVVPYADGKRGNPVLFDRVTFDDLAKVAGDRGGRILFEKFDLERVEWDNIIHFDVDTEEDLQKMRDQE